MKKLFLTLAIAAGISFSSSAQTTTPSSKIGGGFSIGVDGAVPVGSGADIYSWGLGGSIKYDARMYPGIFFTLSAGYEAFFIKSDLKFPGTPSLDNYIPLKGGLKFYLADGFYAEGQAGISIYTGQGSFTAFAYSPGIGYAFSNGIDLGARFEGWSKDGTMNQVAMRLAYRFK